ncbi:MAG: hypothetical protein IKE91_07435 [Clostridia bacterium]|nr:hypothetical protein [Clostridia bacterium]
MGKKKNTKKTTALKPKKKPTLNDYTLEQLVTMPPDAVIKLMLNDPANKDFAYPYRVVMDVYAFIGRYKAHQEKCLKNLMGDLRSANIMQGSTFTLDRRATEIIKATAQTASFKQLDTYYKQAEEMLKKLDHAQELMEEAFKARPDIDDFRRNVLRNVIWDVRIYLKMQFNFLTDEEVDGDD